MTIKALMVDVDGVLVDGRPEDGKHWQASLEDHLAFSPDTLRREFFTPHWDEIVLGQAPLMDRLVPVLRKIAPHVTPDRFVSYWFKQDSRLVLPLLEELAMIRSTGIRVYLATNQEHMRAAYLMQELGLSNHTDGIFYSAQLGVQKPDHAFFNKICLSTSFSPCEFLLIDDRRENVDAAIQAGWQAIHWTSATSLQTLHAALLPER